MQIANEVEELRMAVEDEHHAELKFIMLVERYLQVAASIIENNPGLDATVAHAFRQETEGLRQATEHIKQSSEIVRQLMQRQEQIEVSEPAVGLTEITPDDAGNKQYEPVALPKGKKKPAKHKEKQ